MGQDELQSRLERIRERIALAAQRVGQDPQDVTLLAAAKTVAPERILMAIQLGVRHVGENRVQEAESKLKSFESLRDAATWHLIGHLQTNKARRALQLFDVIQSVDTIRLAGQLERVAAEMNRLVSVYIEVNVGTEQSKSGALPDQLMALAEAISKHSHLRLEGLMAVPPYLENPQAVRPYFRRLRELRQMINDQHLFDYEIRGLSMGMSHDFEVAIEEGATLIRLGTAIWGSRAGLQGV
ncbi:MAG: YggS family pyridoxal phosphate-dependent enzyme [Acidobacteria bacterium]|nr:YggS family pyridoxal phosphate-dependent enzyme [Acidobacteriota bacterium]